MPSEREGRVEARIADVAEMLELARRGIAELIELQRSAIAAAGTPAAPEALAGLAQMFGKK